MWTSSLSNSNISKYIPVDLKEQNILEKIQTQVSFVNLVAYVAKRFYEMALIDEGLGAKRQSYLNSMVVEFFLCYSGIDSFEKSD